jgi:U32 family peptidase
MIVAKTNCIAFLYMGIIIFLGENFMEKTVLGKIIHFYPKISVAVIELEDNLKVGDKIAIERDENSFEQIVDSMQVEHKGIQEAKKGESIGLKTKEATKEGARVFKVIE